jgi:hypothetical protein
LHDCSGLANHARRGTSFAHFVTTSKTVELRVHPAKQNPREWLGFFRADSQYLPDTLSSRRSIYSFPPPMKIPRLSSGLSAAAFLAVLAFPALVHSAAPRTEFANGVQPQMTVGADGRVWLVYAQPVATAAPSGGPHDGHGGHDKSHGEKAGGQSKKKGHGSRGSPGDIFVASSTDGGATFAPAVKVAHLPQLIAGNRRGPRIAAHGDAITVTAIAHELVAFTSRDAGKTWSAPVTINDVPNSAHEGLHDLAASPAGQLFVTWLDLRSGKTELWAASSRDGGRTWGKNEQLYKSPDKSICECCHPSALFDADGHLAVMWRNSIEGSRDMWMMTRAKGATAFSTARKLGEGTWKINGCPHDGGTLVALGGGNFAAVWQRSGEIFVTGPDDKETKLGAGRQPVAIRGAGSTTVVWNDGTALVAVRDLNRPEPTKLAPEARFPIAVSLPGGKGAVVAYERGAKGATTVAVERL